MHRRLRYDGVHRQEMVAFVKVAGPKLKAKGIKVIAPEASEWIHAWSNLSATGSLVASHPQSSDPLKCGCYSNTIGSDDRLHSNVPRRQWLRLRPLALEGSDGLGRLRHLRRARVRLADRVRVAGRRQRWREKQGGLADRDVRREALAGRGAVDSHRQRCRGRRVDSLGAHGRRGFGLALLVVRGLLPERQRRLGPDHRGARPSPSATSRWATTASSCAPATSRWTSSGTPTRTCCCRPTRARMARSSSWPSTRAPRRSTRPDRDHGRDGAGLDDADGDVGDRQPRRQDRGPGERR